MSVSRSELESWRPGESLSNLATGWLEDAAETHGAKLFRLRKGTAREVKALAEEVWVVGIWMKNATELSGWEVKFAPPGNAADAIVRSSPQDQEIEVQIAIALNGEKFNQQMREMNDIGGALGFVGAPEEFDAKHAGLVCKTINGKIAKHYSSPLWLIVGVDNGIEPIKEMRATIRAATAAAELGSGFGRVYLVAMGKAGVVRVK